MPWKKRLSLLCCELAIPRHHTLGDPSHVSDVEEDGLLEDVIALSFVRFGNLFLVEPALLHLDRGT